MTEATYTLRITRNGTKLATEDFAAKITASQRSEVQAWLEGGSSPAQPDTQRWIPVGERLPEMYQKVWVVSGGGKYVDECVWVYAYNRLYSHWMPIVVPAPPEAAMAAAAPKEESNDVQA